MSGLIRHTLGAVGAHTGGSGGAASTADVTFERAAYTWADVAHLAGAHVIPGVIAEGAHLQPGAQRTVTGLVQVLTAWRAWATRLTVLTAHRPLEYLGDGRMAPTGPWRLAKTHTPALGGPARMTRATVPAGVTTTTTPGDDAVFAGVPRTQEHAAFVSTFLPAPVRATVLAALPTPEVWVGDLVRYDTGEERLTMLRMGATTAVVVSASRTGQSDVSTLPWAVTQLVYTLGSAPQLGR